MGWTDQMTGGLKAEFFSTLFCNWQNGNSKMDQNNIYLLFVWLDATEKIIENYLLKYKILLSH